MVCYIYYDNHSDGTVCSNCLGSPRSSESLSSKRLKILHLLRKSTIKVIENAGVQYSYDTEFMRNKTHHGSVSLLQPNLVWNDQQLVAVNVSQL